MSHCKLPRSFAAMANDDVMDATLQIARELYSNGMQKQILFLFLFSSYLMLHLAPTASRVFKASSPPPVCLQEKDTHTVVFHNIGDDAYDGEERKTNVLGFSRT
jgi:hypothetical protein